ncbi:hypothetical protein TKK_0015325 [Trichogramma kaykai]
MLVNEYEKKRILIARHYDGILDIPTIEIANSEELTNLIDKTQQHLDMLASLKVDVDKKLIVGILERKLPVDVRGKWEETLNFDEFPSFEQFIKFISDSAFRLKTVNVNPVNKIGAVNNKRRGEQHSNTAKLRKVDSGAQSFVTSAQGCCACCQGAHPIYKNKKFENMIIQDRWDLVKSKQLCRNCLRAHSGECSLSHCKLCTRFHNTLLHSTPKNKANSKGNLKPKSETPKKQSTSETPL